MAMPAEIRRRPGNFDKISGTIFKGNALNPHVGDLPFDIPVRGLTPKDSLLSQVRDGVRNFSMFQPDPIKQRALGDELLRVTEELEKLKERKRRSTKTNEKIDDLGLVQEYLRQELIAYVTGQAPTPLREQPSRPQRLGLRLQAEQIRGISADQDFIRYLRLKEKLERTGELKKGRRGKKGDYEIFEELRRIYEEN